MCIIFIQKNRTASLHDYTFLSFITKKYYYFIYSNHETISYCSVAGKKGGVSELNLLSNFIT